MPQEQARQVTRTGDDSGTILHGRPNWFYKGKN